MSHDTITVQKRRKHVSLGNSRVTLSNYNLTEVVDTSAILLEFITFSSLLAF